MTFFRIHLLKSLCVYGGKYKVLQIDISPYDREKIDECLLGIGRKKTYEEIFYDMCFCLCAPQTTFKSNRKVLNRLMKMSFYVKDYSLSVIVDAVKEARFKNNKARYLTEAKKKFPAIIDLLEDEYLPVVKKRAFLVEEIAGFGMKSASHFLRNCGDQELAIIDTHILKFLEAPLPSTKKKYELLEIMFTSAAKEYELTPAGLDAYIWKYFSKTPWEEFNW